MADKLTDKQKKFADYYIMTQNPGESALRAGYSEASAQSTGYRLLNNPKIKQYLSDQLDEIETDDHIAGRDDILKFYTHIMHDTLQKTRDRLHAADSMAKIYGMFIDKKQLKVSDKKLEDFFS